jgi:NADPH:quinone reductase-like Zn-dependent oxidoreductase
LKDLRICYLTAVSAIIKGFGIPLPHLREPPKNNPPNLDDLTSPITIAKQPELPKQPAEITSVLVLGGSSGVGGSAVQLLRQALPDLVIITTNSAAHKEKVTKLGATAWVDRNLESSQLVKAIKQASPDGKGVDAIIDAVAGAADGNGAVFDAFRGDGPKLYSHVMTGTKVNVPHGVKAATVFGRMAFQVDGGGAAMTKLVDLVDAGKFKLPLEIEVVGKGLDVIGGGLEKLKSGVSGKKLVVSL